MTAPDDQRRVIGQDAGAAAEAPSHHEDQIDRALLTVAGVEYNDRAR